MIFTEERVVPGTSADAIAPQAFRGMIRAMRAFNGTVPRLEQDQDERWVRVTLWRTAAADPSA